jgi:hypothetical protein
MCTTLAILHTYCLCSAASLKNKIQKNSRVLESNEQTNIRHETRQLYTCMARSNQKTAGSQCMSIDFDGGEAVLDTVKRRL